MFNQLYRHVILFIALSVLLGCDQDLGKGDGMPRIDRTGIESAQEILGLTFTETEMDTMVDYLTRNLTGYDSMRTKSLDYDVLPAILFDPRPMGFKIPTEQKLLEWPAPSQITLPKDKEALAYFTIPQLAYLIANQKISSLELTTFFIDRLKKYDPILRTTITFTEAMALQQAKRADQEIAAGQYKGLLHGIPYGVKDIIAVEGYKTTWGAAPYKDQIINQTATIVRKLEEAGAVLIAKLTSGALARGDVWFGGKTLNPWDTLQGASGSSAGSASAVAAGLVPFAIGTETLGSIVSPSNRCGTTGLRPTYGRVSRYGVMSLSWSMDKVGPIAGNAMDCAIVFEAIRGKDPLDRTTYEAAFNFDINQPTEDLKIGYLKTAFEEDTTAAGENGRLALESFHKMGLVMEVVTLPENLPYEAFDIILRAESGAFFDELVRNNGDDLLVQQNKRSRANSLRQSRFIPAVEYLQANRYRSLLIEEMHHIMQKYDVVIAPTFGGRQLLITNLTGHPALAIPTGLDDKGRPTSITLLGNLFDEASILRLGIAFQENSTYEDVHPPLFSAF